jgi:hypothetical protein
MLAEEAAALIVDYQHTFSFIVARPRNVVDRITRVDEPLESPPVLLP